MINYASYSLKLVTSHEVFVNVNRAAFPDEVKMFNVPQIFVFFPTYDEFHPDSCRPVSLVT